MVCSIEKQFYSGSIKALLTPAARRWCAQLKYNSLRWVHCLGVKAYGVPCSSIGSYSSKAQPYSSLKRPLKEPLLRLKRGLIEAGARGLIDGLPRRCLASPPCACKVSLVYQG